MSRVLIIAEAGVNHNGQISLAKELIDAASEAGADIVKFQTFKADTLVSRKARKATYQLANMMDDDDSQYEMLKRLELSHKDHQELINYAKEKNIGFFSTAFDVEGVYYLNSLGFDQFKIPSGELTNYPYLKCLAEIGKPVILSTGMANMNEIEEALDVLTAENLKLSDITILHCNTQYPTPMEDVNLTAMNTIAHTFGVRVGYSDHTLGIEVPVAAVALGARVIEKHFTLNRNLPGPDHKASLEPHELSHMVRAIRNVEIAVSGSGKKETTPSEEANKIVARKSLHLRENLKKGHVLVSDDLVQLRPGSGISPMRYGEVVGKKLIRDLKREHMLSFEDFQ